MPDYLVGLILIERNEMSKFVSAESLVAYGEKIAIAIIVFVIGWWAAKMIVRALKKAFARSKVDVTLTDFIANIAYAFLIAVVVLTALNKLGVPTSSALAILGAAGLAIGLALQNSLSNFASGVMLIIFRPFRVGDFIEAGGTSGVVEAITIFSTALRTSDNKEVTVPNAQIHKGVIVNYSAKENRRIDLIFSIGYDDDIQKAKQILQLVLDNESRILKDPVATIMVVELGDHSIDIATKPWVLNSDYGVVKSDLLEKVKLIFDKNGISIPYMQQDVHIKSAPKGLLNS